MVRKTVNTLEENYIENENNWDEYAELRQNSQKFKEDNHRGVARMWKNIKYMPLTITKSCALPRVLCVRIWKSDL